MEELKELIKETLLGDIEFEPSDSDETNHMETAEKKGVSECDFVALQGVEL